jgi:predicted O-methyltransferase YrrM
MAAGVFLLSFQLRLVATGAMAVDKRCGEVAHTAEPCEIVAECVARAATEVAMGLRTALGLKKKKKKPCSSDQGQRPLVPEFVSALYKRHPSLRVVEDQLRIDGREGALALAPREGVGVELGVFTGRFSEVLYAATAPKKLYLVDGWRKLYGDKFPNWGAYTDYGRLSTDVALQLVRARAQHLGGDVEIVEETSTTWLERQPQLSLDWAYLDTSHAYESTLQELALLDAALKPNGIVLGDDCRIDPKHRHHGVFMAVRDFCKERPYEIIHMDAHGQWAIRRDASIQESDDRTYSATPTPPQVADIDTQSWFEGKQFTSDWLTPKLQPWFTSLAHLRDFPAQVLDVGSYEGRSCVAFLSLLPQSTVTAIDTFGSDEVTLKAEQPSEVEGRFDNNVAPFAGRVRKMKDRAANALDELLQGGHEFDVIYLDAAKSRSAAIAHSVMAWPLLKIGGVLIWDDLKWGGSLPSRDRPSDAIHLFCDTFADSLEVLHCDRQMLIKKLSDWPIGRRMS